MRRNTRLMTEDTEVIEFKNRRQRRWEERGFKKRGKQSRRRYPLGFDYDSLPREAKADLFFRGMKAMREMREGKNVMQAG